MILPSSTGGGRPLDTTKIRTGCKLLAHQLSEEVEYGERFAKAIMTTDHHPKFAHVVLKMEQKFLVCKGRRDGGAEYGYNALIHCHGWRLKVE